MLERFGDETMSLEITTILKLAKAVVEKYTQTNTQPGLVIEQKGQKLKVRFTELIDALEDLSKKDVAVIRRCKDCNNWGCAPNSKEGSCFPKDITYWRKGNDYCSKNYIPRSEEMRKTDESVNKLLSKE